MLKPDEVPELVQGNEFTGLCDAHRGELAAVEVDHAADVGPPAARSVGPKEPTGWRRVGCAAA